MKLTWYNDTLLPLDGDVTSAHGFCFYEDKLLMVDLNHRGWDLPGGHIEPGETVQDCFKRECMEEGYVFGECTPLGYIAVDHSENVLWDKSSIYPKIGFQVFYRMDITEIHELGTEYESTQRIFINYNDISDYHSDWNSLYEEILICSLNCNK